jgi:hypothetical protein
MVGIPADEQSQERSLDDLHQELYSSSAHTMPINQHPYFEDFDIIFTRLRLLISLAGSDHYSSYVLS